MAPDWRFLWGKRKFRPAESRVYSRGYRSKNSLKLIYETLAGIIQPENEVVTELDSQRDLDAKANLKIAINRLETSISPLMNFASN